MFELANGYKSKTTFWIDFSIADHFGTAAVKDTYERAFKEWKDDVVYLTELSLVLNHKIWQWYTKNDELAMVYDSIWRQTDKYAKETLTGDDYRYYWKWTD